MAAFNFNQFTDASLEIDSYNNRTYAIAVYTAANTTTGVGQGPIPFVTRYSPSGSVAFLYVQCDRSLVTSGAMTTIGNYAIVGTSAPTVTAVAFTTGKNYIRLTLSGTIPVGQYFLRVADSTFGDGSVFNVATAVPIYVDSTPTQSGIAQAVTLGTPVMSHT